MVMKNKKIYIAGHTGMVGSAVYRKFKENGYNNFLVKEINQVDLIRQEEVDKLFKDERPEYVIIAAAKIQLKMLEQQVLLSTAAGRAAEAATLSIQVSELKALVTVFKKLIVDPKLSCDMYLENTTDK